MSRITCYALIVLLIIPWKADAEIKTYTHSVKQSFGGSQSPDDARIAAIHKAKREALEKAGTYLESLTIVKNSMVEKDEILALAAGVLKAEVVSQKNYAAEDTFGIIVTAKVDVDTSILNDRVKKLLIDKTILEKYKIFQRREKELLTKIEELEEQNRKLQNSSAENKEEKMEDLEKNFKALSQALRQTDTKKLSEALRYEIKANEWVKDGRCIDPDKSLYYIDKAIELYPESEVNAYFMRGNIWAQQGDYVRAISNYDKAIEIELRDVVDGVKISFPMADKKIYCNRGLAWYKKGSYDKAIFDFNKVIDLDSNNAEAYFWRGSARVLLGDYDRAIADHSKAIEIDPNYSEPYYGRGFSWYLKGDYDRACSDYQKACELGECRLLNQAKKEGLCQ